MLIRSFLVAAFAVFAYSATAEAAVYNAFVSATGVDTRPCTVQAQPCKTLQRAATVTSAGGTIRILSDLSDNVSITKSLTIEGGGNSMIGLVAINNAAAVVTLRGLHLNGRGAVTSGIRITTAAAVYIQDCTVERYTNDGIKFVASTATKLFMSNTDTRANGSDGLYADAVNAQVVIQNSRFEGNASSGLYLKVKRATVIASVSSGNNVNGIILSKGSADFTETTASNNGTYGFYIQGGYATLASSVAHDNVAWGLYIAYGALAIINQSVFNQNGTGIYYDGTLVSLGNNTLLNNNSFATGGSGLKLDKTGF